MCDGTCSNCRSRQVSPSQLVRLRTKVDELDRTARALAGTRRELDELKAAIARLEARLPVGVVFESTNGRKV